MWLYLYCFINGCRGAGSDGLHTRGCPRTTFDDGFCTALQNILSLIRMRTQTFDVCALCQIAIPLLAWPLFAQFLTTS